MCLQSFPDTHFPVVLSTMFDFDTILQAKTKPITHTDLHAYTPRYTVCILCIIYTYTHTHREGRVVSFGVVLCL
jgi:hypothetical protein